MTFETGIFGMLSKTQTSQTCFLSLWTSSDVTDLSNYFVYISMFYNLLCMLMIH